MPVILANNVASTLAQDITAASGSLIVKSGTGSRFPVLTAGQYFYATLIATDGRWEIVKATARSGDTITITRAQESTHAGAFAAGSKIELRITAQSVRDVVSDDKEIYIGPNPPDPTLYALWVDTTGI